MLISGHGQVGAWGLVDIMAIDTDEFIIEVAMEWAWPPLRIELFSITSSLGYHNGGLIRSALRTFGVSIDESCAVLIGFSVPWRAVNADIKNPASSEGWERRLDGGGFGDSIRRALGLGVWIFLQNGVEGCFRMLADLQHVDSRRELVGDLVSERIDISHLVGEFAP